MTDFAHVVGRGYVEDRDDECGSGELLRIHSEILYL